MTSPSNFTFPDASRVVNAPELGVIDPIVVLSILPLLISTCSITDVPDTLKLLTDIFFTLFEDVPILILSSELGTISVFNKPLKLIKSSLSFPKLTFPSSVVSPSTCIVVKVASAGVSLPIIVLSILPLFISALSTCIVVKKASAGVSLPIIVLSI